MGDYMKASHRAVIAGLAALIFTACSAVENREDFATMVKNKTEDEVMKFAGKPAGVDQADAQHITWVYKSRTFDVQTRARDAETAVIFSPGPDGKLHVVDVQFK
jgi:hypothetical protein